MRILIVGSGTAGGLIGTRLIERGADVTFLVRPERKAQIMTVGLMLSSPFGRFRRPVHAITPDELTGVYGLVIMATRAQGYGVALNIVEKAIGPETLVLPGGEGADQLASGPVPNGGRLIGAVFEGRVGIDADGLIVQREPVAELQIGAMDERDADRAEMLASLLGGRGLTTILSDRITAAIWERYCFTAAAVAVNALTGLSLRNAIRPTHHLTSFDRLLSEGIVVGQALGLHPRPERVSDYQRSFRLDTRPVQPPALITSHGRGADEAAHLLLEMASLAERAGVPAPRLTKARDVLVRPRASTFATVDTAAGQGGDVRHGN